MLPLHLLPFISVNLIFDRPCSFLSPIVDRHLPTLLCSWSCRSAFWELVLVRCEWRFIKQQKGKFLSRIAWAGLTACLQSLQYLLRSDFYSCHNDPWPVCCMTLFYSLNWSLYFFCSFGIPFFLGLFPFYSKTSCCLVTFYFQAPSSPSWVNVMSAF